jgi:hypothetical protein
MNDAMTGNPTSTIQLFQALGVVSFVFLSALGIVWCLKKLGGKPSADVRGGANGSGWKLAVTATGLVGSYLAIVIAEFSGIYFVAQHVIK